MAEIPACTDQFPEVSMGAHQPVFSQGQACQHYIVLTSGQVKVFARSEDGRELVLYRVQPGEVCILAAACLMGGNDYFAEAMTESEVTARVIPRDSFDLLLETDKQFRTYIFNNFSQRLTGLMLQLEQITFDSIDHRLRQFLYRMTEQKRQLVMTHQEIATEIGSAREVVSRSLKKLEKQGLIQLGRGTVEVPDRQALNP